MQPHDPIELEAIRQLKARYFRFLDQKRWREFGELFTEDGRLDSSDDAPHAVAAGREAIVALVSGAVGQAVTVHHGHMPEIEITGPGRARGIWAMEDHLELPGDPPALVVHGRGHYFEEYEKGPDGAWRIKSLRLVRLWLTHDGRRVVPRPA
ncbi:MAG: nuclear transport factor 2 family protein [Thermodesulfobacteriota bacterium]